MLISFQLDQLNAFTYDSTDSVIIQPQCHSQSYKNYLHNLYGKAFLFIIYLFDFLCHFFIHFILFTTVNKHKRVCALILYQLLFYPIGWLCIQVHGPHRLRPPWALKHTQKGYFWKFKYSKWRFTWSGGEIPHDW
jgi:hypothetical protein